ncbi:MAG: hypothetical protein JWR77_2611 [Rhizorhabdus sp.]|uniref:hypothetical protein n=1 Tax=Sphingomonas bacterium TaxID=1895847 RepID=UPI002627CDE0|nr:hypothetical protein [Sphingomonas bacterium]MDB5688022.1 hypothetical protein [Rhizorhabdus sp.]MDB5709912.1 hypothetical protein [Sphingomonas bacterium]
MSDNHSFVGAAIVRRAIDLIHDGDEVRLLVDDFPAPVDDIKEIELCDNDAVAVFKMDWGKMVLATRVVTGLQVTSRRP